MAMEVASTGSAAMRKRKAPEANRARILAAATAEFAATGLRRGEHERDRDTADDDAA